MFENINHTLRKASENTSVQSDLDLCDSYTIYTLNPFPKQQIIDSELKESADDNLKFDGNGKKFSKRIENTVGKGEICWKRSISSFPTVFSKGLYCRHIKPGLVWEKG